LSEPIITATFFINLYLQVKQKITNKKLQQWRCSFSQCIIILLECKKSRQDAIILKDLPIKEYVIDEKQHISVIHLS
ncbi:MAG: hypothetical protein KH702_11000, partial [Ruminococcus bicirculans]|nr:hypothetical protein [Ruminococcus bicirculans (ex Wegman et al. 2014)]